MEIRKTIGMIEYKNIGDLTFNPINPRKINETKINQLKKSLVEFPEMLKLRPIVVDSNYVVLGGNMRLKACMDLGIELIPVVKAEDLTENQKKEFIIKDNVSFGEWDWDIIESDFDIDLVQDWGLDVPIDEETEEEKYTRKIKAPTYEPMNQKPKIEQLVDTSRMMELINKIENSDISDEEKQFLILASYRHIVFDYSKIADFYAHSNQQMQELMESSALVIIDYNKAIEEGYVRLSQTLSELYSEDHDD
jgi:hypothetical protein